MPYCSQEYETLFRKTGQEVLHQLSVYDGNVERQMQRIENLSDLEKFTLQVRIALNGFSFHDINRINNQQQQFELSQLLLQGLHDFWDTVKQESVIRRKWIKDLDDTLAKYESDRTAMVSLIQQYYKLSLCKLLDIVLDIFLLLSRLQHC